MPSRKTADHYRSAFWGLLLLIYIVVLVLFLLTKNFAFDVPDQVNPTLTELLLLEDTSAVKINLQPFFTIKLFFSALSQPQMVLPSIANLLGNIVAFMPIGILYGLARRGRSYFVGGFLLTLVTTLTVEGIQLLTGWGVFDVDDLILNSLGGLCGLACFALFHRN